MKLKKIQHIPSKYWQQFRKLSQQSQIIVILLGTATAVTLFCTATYSSVESIETVSVPRTTHFVEDETLFEGNNVTKSEGNDGSDRVNYQIVRIAGLVINKSENKRTALKKPVEKVVNKGILVKSTKTESIDIPYTEEVRQDNTKWIWANYIQTSGKAGLKSQTFEIVTSKSVEKSRTLIKELVITQPVNQIRVKGGFVPYGEYDCPDFDTHEEAQDFFVHTGPGDPYRLDGDYDGLACEANRSADYEEYNEPDYDSYDYY